jgi:hypothetical protein
MRRVNTFAMIGCWLGVAGCGDESSYVGGSGEEAGTSEGGEEDASPVEIAQDRFVGNCAVLSGELRCWSDLAYGAGEIEIARDRAHLQRDVYRPTPIPTIELGEPVVAVAEPGAVCAILDSGAARCWGENIGFGLGIPGSDEVIVGDDANERGLDTPTLDLGAGLRVLQVIVAFPMCARFDDGRVKCWGSHPYGTESDETLGDQAGEMGDNLPFIDLGENVRAAGLVGGGGHVCIWTEQGQVKCWGGNHRGECGVRFGVDDVIGDAPGEMGDLLPFVDLGSDVRVVQVTTGEVHTCVLTDEGRIKCWGGNSEPATDHPVGPNDPATWFGRLGLEQMDDWPEPGGDALPYLDLGTGFVAVAVRAYVGSTCAVSDDRRVKCWGAGLLGWAAEEDIGDEPGEMGDALPYIDLGTGRTIKMIGGYRWPIVMLDNNSVLDWRNTTLHGYGDSIPPTVTHEELFGAG